MFVGQLTLFVLCHGSVAFIGYGFFCAYGHIFAIREFSGNGRGPYQYVNRTAAAASAAGAAAATVALAAAVALDLAGAATKNLGKNSRSEFARK